MVSVSNTVDLEDNNLYGLKSSSTKSRGIFSDKINAKYIFGLRSVGQ